MKNGQPFTFRLRLVVSDDRLSKHTHGEWYSTEYVKEGKFLDNSAMERCFGRLTECYYGK